MEECDNILKGHYKIGNLLGQGAFAKVYKAQDTKDKNKFYAIKQLSKNRINDSDYLLKALEKEIEIMRLMDHENSVRLIENFETEDNYNIVMELCDTDLDVVLQKHFNKKKRGFNELELWLIMNQFNKIFLKMTKINVIHRDLKLKNIMIKYDKNVEILGFIIKLSDFGFSKVLNDEDITSTLLGTPSTQAPEIKNGKGYNKKCDLWSIGVIIFSLLFNRLPFKSKRKSDLFVEIANWKGVELPKDNNNPITETCSDLIKKLLIKEPEKRIEFEAYFNHKFFSEEHKKILEENQKTKENKKEEDKKETENQNENNNKKTEENKIKIIEIKDIDKEFKKILIIKEYNGYKLYKGKNLSNNKYVYIKEISRSIIDNNNENKIIFDKEIELLSTLKGKNFPEFFGLSKTDTHYNIIIEYFSGNILYDFIKSRKKPFDKSFINSILEQLQPSFSELKNKDIIINKNILQCLAFSFYQSKLNFEIKFFDYGLISIFSKYIETDNNITSNNSNFSYFRYEDFVNYNSNENENKNNNNNNILVKKEPKIKDEEIEYLFEIIINNINNIYDYFNTKFKDKDNYIYDEIYSCYSKEIIMFLYFCSLECETILQFLKINADIDIDKTNQEIHLLKIYSNEDNNNKCDYSYINFIEQSTKNNDYFYNKENPSFEYYQKIFNELKNKINNLFTELKGYNQIFLNNENNINDIKLLNDNNDKSELIILNRSEIFDMNNGSFINKINLSNKNIGKILNEGNIEKLFKKMFENIIVKYSSEIKDNIINELNISKYLIEYILFIRAIFGKINNKLYFDNIFENKESGNVIILATFIGGKIKSIVEKGLFTYKEKENNFNLKNIGSEEENFYIYNKMIYFYKKIRKWIDELK